jgi:hypothetical protein
VRVGIVAVSSTRLDILSTWEALSIVDGCRHAVANFWALSS